MQILELFGGIGAPRIALRNLGIQVKAIDYVEIDEKAVISYNAMFEDDLEYKPQSVVGWNLKPDILIHGSPCQDISIAGKKLGADQGSNTRSSLMWETINIIKNMGEWKPRIVIWENVKAVLHKTMNKNFNRYLEELEKIGYTNSYEVLNALDYGLPQARERVFTVSYLNGNKFNFQLMEKRPYKHINHYLEEYVDDRYTIKTPSMLKAVYGSQEGKFKRKLDVIQDHCKTISTKQNRCPNAGIVPTSDGKYRLLTEKECWLLQGYNERDYEKAASVNGSTALYKQAGNSIPVTIFEEMFKVMINDIR